VNLPEKVRSAGVVGVGGAGFPTHVKLRGKAEVIIANGAECEPLLGGDRWLMANFAGRIADGLRAAADSVGASRAIAAIKGKYSEAVAAMREALGGVAEILLLDDFYPAGDEQEITYEATGRVVPEGGIPLDVGVVVSNVETLFNVAGALEGEPVTRKLVSVAGSVRNPSLVWAPIGLSFGDLVAAVGGPTVSEFFIAVGGPLMGQITYDLLTPVTKTTNAVILLPRGHPLEGRISLRPGTAVHLAAAYCTQCRDCTDLCPRYLLGHSMEPHRVMRALACSKLGDGLIPTVLLCSECGCCELYACPMGLMPRKVITELKGKLLREGRRWGLRKESYLPRPERETGRIPVSRITSRLRLSRFETPTSLLPDDRLSFRKLSIPLKQHIGSPASPTVKVGDRVRAGDIVGDLPGDVLGAPVHSPIDGTVVSVDSDRVEIEP